MITESKLLQISKIVIFKWIHFRIVIVSTGIRNRQIREYTEEGVT